MTRKINNLKEATKTKDLPRGSSKEKTEANPSAPRLC